MKLQMSPKVTFLAKALFYCGIAAVTAVLANGFEKGFANWNPFARKPPQLTTEDFIRDDGFNFNLLMEGENSWADPKVGDSIDFSAMRSRDDRSLSDALQERELSMLVLVAATCETCKHTTGYMQQVRDEMAQRGVGYYLITIDRRERPEELFDYADSLKLNVRSFRWVYEQFGDPKTFDKIIVPAHLLVDRNQVVRGVWPGANIKTAITDKMAMQIKKDVDKIIAGK
jgi:hypothetical protein